MCLLVMVKRSSSVPAGFGSVALRDGSRALACSSASLSCHGEYLQARELEGNVQHPQRRTGLECGDLCWKARAGCWIESLLILPTLMGFEDTHPLCKGLAPSVRMCLLDLCFGFDSQI
jgi:hypothetical protein